MAVVTRYLINIIAMTTSKQSSPSLRVKDGYPYATLLQTSLKLPIDKALNYCDFADTCMLDNPNTNAHYISLLDSILSECKDADFVRKATHAKNIFRLYIYCLGSHEICPEFPIVAL